MTRELTIEVKTKIRWDHAKVIIPVEITIGGKTEVRQLEKPLGQMAEMIADRAGRGLDPIPEE